MADQTESVIHPVSLSPQGGRKVTVHALGTDAELGRAFTPGDVSQFLRRSARVSRGRISNRSRVLTRKNLPMLRKWLALDVQLAETAVYRRFGPAAQAAMTELLRDFSQEVDPSYAQVGYNLSLGRTEHEERVGPPLPSMTLPESRRLLRGYEWLMVIPREIAQQLGGDDGISAAGDFHRVETLRDGAVLLQATPEFDGFTVEAIERTWRLVRPALRPGMPKRFDSDPECPPSRIWYADLAWPTRGRGHSDHASGCPCFEAPTVGAGRTIGRTSVLEATAGTSECVIDGPGRRVEPSRDPTEPGRVTGDSGRALRARGSPWVRCFRPAGPLRAGGRPRDGASSPHGPADGTAGRARGVPGPGRDAADAAAPRAPCPVPGACSAYRP
ncbi:hypothetical protein PV721_32775 [Streptomyces sp. MB09-01]|uniref:hypothetical protein n=1 Tax=Streptomyces sp. MB09-01 TaxID=3028666 RepID=UPI0029B7A326|nr:hypothetical protein [Streptomyces sp. MB09-01]MDX3539024.1 hypothetical protein [Streptomyces sp. MB09-01]